MNINELRDMDSGLNIIRMVNESPSNPKKLTKTQMISIISKFVTQAISKEKNPKRILSDVEKLLDQYYVDKATLMDKVDIFMRDNLGLETNHSPVTNVPAYQISH